MELSVILSILSLVLGIFIGLFSNPSVVAFLRKKSGKANDQSDQSDQPARAPALTEAQLEKAVTTALEPVLRELRKPQASVASLELLVKTSQEIVRTILEIRDLGNSARDNEWVGEMRRRNLRCPNSKIQCLKTAFDPDKRLNPDTYRVPQEASLPLSNSAPLPKQKGQFLLRSNLIGEMLTYGLTEQSPNASQAASVILDNNRSQLLLNGWKIPWKSSANKGLFVTWVYIGL